MFSFLSLTQSAYKNFKMLVNVNIQQSELLWLTYIFTVRKNMQNFYLFGITACPHGGTLYYP